MHFLTQIAQEHVKSGKLKNWDVSARGSAGHTIFEGNEIELSKELGKYNPYLKLKLTWF